MNRQLTSEQVERFITQQLERWPMAAENYRALSAVKSRNLDVDGLSVKTQFNPARIKSSSAKIDAQSLAERVCFLCDSNRPSQQMSIDWGERYSVLVNPYPIFDRHLTIAARDHCPQTIGSRFEDMISLTSQLRTFTIFYNGPKCGASAPDHMHFQAVNSASLTLYDNFEDSDLRTVVESDGASLAYVDTLPLNFFVINSDDAVSGAKMFARLTDALYVQQGDNEPMMNILCRSDAEAKISTIIIPRKRHRPTFYGEANGQMLISPASVDMGGVFVIPRLDDFERFDAEVARQIYAEVCLSNSEISEIVSNVR